MSRPGSTRQAATFIVRMWTEHRQGEAPQWRGQMEHVQSGEQAYFRKLEQILDLIVAYRGAGRKEQRGGSNEKGSADDIQGKESE